MAKRISVDIEGLREEIERAYSNDKFWCQLSLAQKIRILIQDGLEKAKTQESKPN
ncbi:hypothetical protein QUB80_26470 [Chlorogloeopsis sp. ULAP01]|uniref:hypothetical protein n=1 Tax=Chlorogloeopsis sp. ULAP01 TaxID=3056483 RepID=UPI0025AB41C0|nr:hypothetical protein [Chlorogloeopsis sp. ULAP01]MDM9384226.1 hypothetical protein [Chlorogloeopsis sp. ULAP01]